MIIVDISQNFSSLDEAKELARLAKENGADLAKAQLFDSMGLYGKHTPAELDFDQAKALFEYGKEIGIEVFFSVFDVERVKWCEKMEVKRYKIACGCINMAKGKNIELASALMGTGKELIISYSRVPDYYYPEYKYLKKLYCVPQYPASISDVDFNAIVELDGFSDHTIGLDAAKIALARGARIIEKHFCFAHDRGIDAAWSMTPSELRELKRWEGVVKQVI